MRILKYVLPVLLLALNYVAQAQSLAINLAPADTATDILFSFPPPGSEQEYFLQKQTTITEFSPDKRTFLTVQEDENVVSLWDMQQGRVLQKLQLDSGRIRTAYYCPDAKNIIVIASNTASLQYEENARLLIYLWNSATGSVLQKSVNENLVYFRHLKKVAFLNPDGETLAFTTSYNNVYQYGTFWNATTGELLYHLEGFTEWVTPVVFSPDGKRFLTAKRGGDISVNNTKTGDLLFRLDGHPTYPERAIFSSNGKWIISNDVSDNGLKVWDSKSGNPLATLLHPHQVVFFAENPDKETVLTWSSDHYFRIWHIQTGQLLKTFKRESESAGSVFFSPDGKKIVTCDYSLESIKIKVWNLENGKNIELDYSGELFDFCHFSFSRNGRKIIGIFENEYSNKITIFDSGTGKSLYTSRYSSLSFTDISASFNSDGNIFVQSLDDGRIVVVETGTGKILLQLYDFGANRQVITSSEGYFDASPEALIHLYVEYEGQHIPLDSYQKQYHIPDLWEKVIKGEQISKNP